MYKREEKHSGRRKEGQLLRVKVGEENGGEV